MEALIVIDAQNEFSQNGKRPVPNYLHAIEIIKKHVEQARMSKTPIAWVRHGPFDIAFTPINAARLNQGKVRDTGIPAVMCPEQAVVASRLLNAAMVCPIHYGRAEENYFETPDPEGNFLRFARERNAKPLLLKQGEYIEL